MVRIRNKRRTVDASGVGTSFNGRVLSTFIEDRFPISYALCCLSFNGRETCVHAAWRTFAFEASRVRKSCAGAPGTVPVPRRVRFPAAIANSPGPLMLALTGPACLQGLLAMEAVAKMS